MKVIGMIGGMSWESTAEYYRIINQTVRARLGGQHSAKTLLYSVDFQEVEQLQREERWDEADTLMVECGRRLERGGADFLIICTNTMHRSAPAIQSAVALPLLHIADATALRVREAGVRRLGLLGTRFTMEQDFYKGRLAEKHGLDVLVPEEEDRGVIHTVIYEELCRGRIRAESRREYLRIMDGLAARGAEAIVLGCTEISMLIDDSVSPLPTYDTTDLHAKALVAAALA